MVTIKDIAKKLNISHTTVSMVLNGRAGKYRISEVVARKVQATADELGYVRNAIARSMTTGRTDTVAFFVRSCDLQSEYMLRIISGVLKVTDKYGFSLKIFEWDPVNRDMTIRRLQEQRISGILVHHHSNTILMPWLNEFKRLNIPCCVANMRNYAGTGGGVNTDDAGSIAEAVQYLSSLGHEKIAYLTAEGDYSYLRERENGYLEGMRQIACPPDIKKIPAEDFGSNLERLSEFLRQPKKMRPTAVICDSDYRAQELLQASYRCGVRVPEELSIVGFGGLSPAVFSAVPLTTIEQSFEEIGYRAAELLVNHIDGKSLIDGKNVTLANRLKIADSTAKPSGPLHRIRKNSKNKQG